jgi:hypothetical protein
MREAVAAAATLTVSLAFALAGCSSKESTPAAPSTESVVASSTASVAAPPEQPAGYVSRATWTDGPWPLTVDEAVLDCQGDSIVTITAGDQKYALNAAATSTGLPDAKEISIPDPNKPGFSMDARQLIAKGLSLCGVTPAPAPPAGSNRPPGLVEQSTWTDGPWPFTTESATLMCTKAGDLERVTVTANREMYALNGTAKSQTALPDFDVIWRDDPNTGLKVDIGPMLERGRALCEG